ncbi:PH domain-containing protein [Candidatus Bathyarchaeota archaeon]|nr:PH domain-containing protein [Candidatus Bathyarchaeota archaeon]RJS74171.1 MAG: PH domain-containing protein [Candidatus Bathyarchaeota archaeon]
MFEDVISMLEPGERLIWSGRPLLKPFVLKRLSGLIIPIVFIVFSTSFTPFFTTGWTMPLVSFFILWFGILGFMLFLSSIYPLLLWRNLYYVLTDKRMIVRKGVLGIDYDILDLKYIQQINVNVGVWDKFYGTGTVIIQAIGVSPVSLQSVPNPLNVQKIIKAAAEARKSTEALRS